ncbi:MAG: DUF1330 domain-containing protein [Chloroflexi bacterium]|nr:DUF1330 domain-containing protein [Chloroflexota bacterium]
MACYVIADINVTDPERFAAFIEAVPASVQTHGGKYLIRGGSLEVAQGDWTPGRLVVIEFASLDRARAWFDSPEFEGPRQIQARSSNSNYVFVEGV